MPFASPAISPPSLHCPAPDTAQGAEGMRLQRLVRDATAPPPDRAEEIYSRVTNALERAQEAEGLTVTLAAFRNALTLLEQLPSNLPLPHVVVESENALGLDWDLATDNVLSASVDDAAFVGYAGIVNGERAYGRTKLGTAEAPPTLVFFLHKLFARRAAGARSDS